jgi:transcriptional regulator with XRE-family HTH domain
MAKKKSTGFATRLRELREAAGLTQAQLAERSGMHTHGVTKIEQGDREPSWATVLALAGALGVNVSVFAAGVTEQEPDRPRGRPSKPARTSSQDVPPSVEPTKPPSRRKGKAKAKRK